jgi:hypothetical protein
MSKRKVTTLILSVALTLMAFGGIFVYSHAAAQSPTPGAPAQSTQTAPTDQSAPNPQPGMRGGPQDGAAHDAELAAALGISTEKLQAAFQSANEAALKEAVSQGLMTQAQADELSANGLPTRPLREIERGADYEALLAKALGISTDQLKAARQQVETAHIDAMLADGQITQTQADDMKARNALFADAKFQASMKSAFEAGVQQAVTDGILTQAQADQIIKDNAAGPGLPMGGGRGGPGGHGDRGPRP